MAAATKNGLGFGDFAEVLDDTKNVGMPARAPARENHESTSKKRISNELAAEIPAGWSTVQE